MTSLKVTLEKLRANIIVNVGTLEAYPKLSYNFSGYTYSEFGNHHSVLSKKLNIQKKKKK